MRFRFLVASMFLRAGMTLGPQADDRAIRRLLGRLHPVKLDRELVRVGADGDGGYLLPDDLDGISACFSPGVAVTAHFEERMVERGIACFLADASVERAPIEHPLVRFQRKFLGVVEDDLHITLDDWVDRDAPGHADLLLQMDIEGAEWPVLLNVSPETLRRFRIIVLELHDLDRVFDKATFKVIEAAFGRLLQDFVVVHNHPNNWDGEVRKGDIVVPRAIEVTLLRKDRANVTGYADRFPHPLDMTNRPDAPDIVLPAIWRR